MFLGDCVGSWCFCHGLLVAVRSGGFSVTLSFHVLGGGIHVDVAGHDHGAFLGRSAWVHGSGTN